MSFLRNIWNITKREAAMIARDHSLLLTLLIAPIVYAFFYGSIYINKEETEVKLAVIDADHSSLSRLLTEQLNNTQAIDVISAASVEDAQELMNDGYCQGYLYLEKGMEKKVLSLHQSKALLALNVGRFLPSSDILSAVTEVSLTVSAGVRLQYFQKNGMTEAIAMRETMPVSLDYRPLYNERSSYGAFLLPGLLMLILQQTLLIGLACSFAGEREKNTLSELLQLSNHHYSLAVWGKGFFYFILFGCYAFFFLNVNFTVLHLPNRGNELQLALLLMLFICCLISFGTWLGSLFSTQLMAAQIMTFTTYPIFLITGYVWPFESLPWAIQWLSTLLPTTPFLKIYLSIVQQGGSLTENAPAILHLIILWFLYSALATLRMQQLSKKLSYV